MVHMMKARSMMLQKVVCCYRSSGGHWSLFIRDPSGANLGFWSKCIPSPRDLFTGTLGGGFRKKSSRRVAKTLVSCTVNTNKAIVNSQIHPTRLSLMTIFHWSTPRGPTYHRLPSVLKLPHSNLQCFMTLRFLPHALSGPPYIMLSTSRS